MKKYAIEKCLYCGSDFQGSAFHHNYCSDKCRLLKHINIPCDDGCWEYSGLRNRDGYGRFPVHSKDMKAHRVMWSFINGDIPKGLSVLHHCDNPPCCNPSHLYLGTPKDNMRDMEARNRRKRSFKGSLNNQAKLDEQKVLVIKHRLAQGEGLTKIAREYNVHPVTIFDIKYKNTWLHV